MAQSLKAIKQFGVDDGLEAARELANEYFVEIAAIADEFRRTHPDEGNPAVDELLDSVQRKIMKESILMELQNDICERIYKILSPHFDIEWINREPHEPCFEDLFKEYIIREELEQPD